MYQVIVSKPALKELSKIDKSDQQLVFNKIKELQNGNLAKDKPLKGKHKGKFRKRAGDHRIIYLKENDILLKIKVLNEF